MFEASQTRRVPRRWHSGARVHVGQMEVVRPRREDDQNREKSTDGGHANFRGDTIVFVEGVRQLAKNLSTE